jgi:23S rRNA G2069 N7-methylase RlmK/C1962 C5-methylase RlmI
MFFQKVTELIKYRGDNGKTYDVIPLDPTKINKERKNEDTHSNGYE